MRFKLEEISQRWHPTMIFTGMMLVAVTFLWLSGALSGFQSVVAFLVVVACETAYVFAFGAKGRD
jgi:hypothetical protein